MSAPDPRQAALDAVLALVVELGEDMQHGLAALGLTPARSHVLWQLRATGPAHQRVLAEALRTSPRNVTGLVDGLQQAGLVSRNAHPTDRRAVVVALTDAGEQLVDGLEAGQQELAGVLFADRPDSEIAVVADVLAAAVDRLRVAVATAPTVRGSA
ncbi:MarR family transcriptional regulator [Nakamurella sp. YIM 132087]|uniref:MarR family transcriptional regulator n=1 Tax=Nakamurella alba TaxID=2665158 RepID=A0A7K1FI91_9ACTN|nr:MarR family transcriptional regulator [Nakamurella alba]MTD13847.1 MarR family transcriptional regulator [Nakamurella alba]